MAPRGCFDEMIDGSRHARGRSPGESDGGSWRSDRIHLRLVAGSRRLGLHHQPWVLVGGTARWPRRVGVGLGAPGTAGVCGSSFDAAPASGPRARATHAGCVSRPARDIRARPLWNRPPGAPPLRRPSPPRAAAAARVPRPRLDGRDGVAPRSPSWGVAVGPSVGRSQGASASRGRLGGHGLSHAQTVCSGRRPLG